jgi:hypothetical protein
MTPKKTTSAPKAPTETNLEIVRLVMVRFVQKESCRTAELTRRREFNQASPDESS